MDGQASHIGEAIQAFMVVGIKPIIYGTTIDTKYIRCHRDGMSFNAHHVYGYNTGVLCRTLSVLGQPLFFGHQFG